MIDSCRKRTAQVGATTIFCQTLGKQQKSQRLDSVSLLSTNETAGNIFFQKTRVITATMTFFPLVTISVKQTLGNGAKKFPSELKAQRWFTCEIHSNRGIRQIQIASGQIKIDDNALLKQYFTPSVPCRT